MITIKRLQVVGSIRVSSFGSGELRWVGESNLLGRIVKFDAIIGATRAVTLTDFRHARVRGNRYRSWQALLHRLRKEYGLGTTFTATVSTSAIIIDFDGTGNGATLKVGESISI